MKPSHPARALDSGASPVVAIQEDGVVFHLSGTIRAACARPGSKLPRRQVRPASSRRLTEAGCPTSSRQMIEIRLFEEEIQRLFNRNLVRGSTHLCSGQEAVVGRRPARRFARATRCSAPIAATEPCWPRAPRSTAPSRRSSARRKGSARGKGGSMHLTDVDGAAPTARSRSSGPICRSPPASASPRSYQGDDAVCLCMFGDGTVNIGAFHEALNLAAVWKLPVIFLCENNLYGEYSPVAAHDADRAARRPRRRPTRCPGVRIDGNDVDDGLRGRRRGGRAARAAATARR